MNLVDVGKGLLVSPIPVFGMGHAEIRLGYGMLPRHWKKDLA
jgi:hypothetical protein